MINTFLSRPTWVPPVFESRLAKMQVEIEAAGFQPHTIGGSQAAIRSPFDDICTLIKKCQCSIILGFPHIHATVCRVKHGEEQKMTFPTEWNQVEAALSLAFNRPTLVLLHNTVAERGVFAPGAANIFVHRFNLMKMGWQQDLKHRLDALRIAVDA